MEQRFSIELNGFPVEGRRNLQHRIMLRLVGVIAQNDFPSGGEAMRSLVNLRFQIVLPDREGVAVKGVQP